MSSSQTIVAKLYQDVIDDVIKNMKQEFENEGIDDQILLELQNVWELKLQELTKADDDGDEPDAEAAPKDEKPTFLYPHQPGNCEGGEEQTSTLTSSRDAAAVDAEQQAADAAATQMLAGGESTGAQSAGGAAPQAQKQKPPKPPKEKIEGESDFSDLGDDLDSSGDDEPETDDIVLCQFEKVTRTKNKWKTTLKDGVMRIGGRDYVFHKGIGEFEW